MSLPFETTEVTRADAVPTPRVQKLFELAAGGNSFWNSLLSQWEKYQHLSDRQWACVEREMDKAPKMARNTPTIEVAPLADMMARFEMALEHIQKPAMVLCDEEGEEYRFNPAPATGQNAGWIYLKSRGDTGWGWGWCYRGKINPQTGELWAAKGQSANDLVQVVRMLLADGLDAAVLHYGHHTSNCGLCGRQLTEELSVASGVGPICASRYGIDRTAFTTK